LKKLWRKFQEVNRAFRWKKHKRCRKKSGITTKQKKEEQILSNFFLKQFKDFLILILFIVAGIAWWADQMTGVYVIFAVILFNAIM